MTSTDPRSTHPKLAQAIERLQAIDLAEACRAPAPPELAAVKLDHGIRLLEAFPPVCHGVDIGRLRTDAAAARKHLLELGPQNLEQFERKLIPKVYLVHDA